MATILKSQGPEGFAGAPQAVAFNFGDVTAKAEAYLQQVREQAKNIVADAQRQAQQIRQQAKRDGAADARAEAERSLQQKVEQQLQFLVPTIQETLVEVNRERATWMRRWEADALKVAVAIAERVVRRQIEQAPQISLDLLREALRLASGMGALKIRLHPHDHAALAEHLEMIVNELEKLTPAEIIEDESVTRGGCRVDTDYGVIDQQIETQLERIRAELSPEE